MKETSIGCLSERHLLLFGAVIQWFARYELLIQEIMAKVAGSDTAAIMLLTSGLDFSGKRRALFDLMRHRAVPLDQYDRIYDYLVPPHTLTPLRNDIAHAAWIASEVHNDAIQPDWILRLPPSIRPLRSDAEGMSDKFIEEDRNKDAYTLDDLAEIAATLDANHARFSDYLRESGFLPGTATRQKTAAASR